MKFLKTPSSRLLPLWLAVCVFGAVPAFAIQPQHSTASSHRLDRLVATDLDGDLKVDIGTLGVSHRAGANFVQSVTVQFNSTEVSTFEITTSSRAHFLSWRDLDSDADRDLIIEGLDREPLAVLVNDGHGHFVPGSVADYLQRLRHRKSNSLEAPPASADSDELAESASDAPAALTTSESRPELVASALVALTDRTELGASQSSSSSRGPPSRL